MSSLLTQARKESFIRFRPPNSSNTQDIRIDGAQILTTGKIEVRQRPGGPKLHHRIHRDHLGPDSLGDQRPNACLPTYFLSGS